jgi:type VI protein secretion system component Hcp
VSEGVAVFLAYSLTNVTVSSVSQSTSVVAPSVTEAITFAPTTVTMTYRPQLLDGSLGAPISFTLNCVKK